MVGGVAVTDAAKTGDQLRERASAAFEQYSNSPPELLEAASSQMAEQLEGLTEDSPRRQELENILDGLHLASIVNGKDDDTGPTDADGNPLRPEPAPSFKVLAKAMAKRGDAESLLGTTEEFYTPETRTTVKAAMEDMDDDQLGDFLGGSESPKGPLIDGLKDSDISDEGKQFIRDLLREMATNEMTTGHALVSAAAEAEARSSGQTTQLASRIKGILKKKYDALTKRQKSPKVMTAMEKMTKCLASAKSPDEIKACSAMGLDLEVNELSCFVEESERAGKLDPNHPVLVQAKRVLETRDPKELEIRYQKAEER